jgi:hypothetical protein
MLATVLILAILLLFGHFELLYWRAKIAGIAIQPISNRVRAAAGISSQVVGARDFRSILSLHEHAPGLQDTGGNFRAVRKYYKVVEKLARLLPASANWANAEMTICSRYVAVVVDQHLKLNIKRAAQTDGLEIRPSNKHNPALLHECVRRPVSRST